ncbi:MAG: DUF3566 domain-containing protein [Acidimicrobiales bacterium]
MSNDADSLIGSDVDGHADATPSEGDQRDAGHDETVTDDEVGGGDVDGGAVGSDEAVTATPSDDGASDAGTGDESAGPFGDDLRLPDEDGYDGVDYADGQYLDDDLDGDYDDGDYVDGEYAEGELLFDGDPDDFELDFGSGPYPAPAATGDDVLVLDDAAAYGTPPPPRRMSRMERRRRVRLQARRVRRIIRHVEPWSVLKISIFFYACLWVIFLVAGFMIWGVAESSGTVDKLESLIRELFALDTFDFDAGQIFRGYALGGLALSIAGTTFNVLMCLLFNLISDLTGGLRITMIEEESARPIPPRRLRRRRRPPPRR